MLRLVFFFFFPFFWGGRDLILRGGGKGEGRMDNFSKNITPADFWK